MREDYPIGLPPLSRILAAALALALLGAGCSDDEEGEITSVGVERRDPPAEPPLGWRTVSNPRAGFTIAAPTTWTDTSTRGRTVIRSDDRLVAVSISADRTAAGRQLSARRYARRTIRTVPRFAGIVDKRIAPVRGAKYENALLTATGTVSPSNLSQRISVAIFRRPGRVTYGVLVFRNAGVKPQFNDRTINLMLRSFRAQPPSR